MQSTLLSVEKPSLDSSALARQCFHDVGFKVDYLRYASMPLTTSRQAFARPNRTAKKKKNREEYRSARVTSKIHSQLLVSSERIETRDYHQ